MSLPFESILVWAERNVGEQLKPSSTAHVALHPSPPTVLPSSQASAPITRLPSPHVVAQNWALVLATVYVLPGYAALHVDWLKAELTGVTVE